MDIERQVRELREEQEKTSYDRSHADTVLPNSKPDEKQECHGEGVPSEDCNVLRTNISVDIPCPSSDDENN